MTKTVCVLCNEPAYEGERLLLTRALAVRGILMIPISWNVSYRDALPDGTNEAHLCLSCLAEHLASVASTLDPKPPRLTPEQQLLQLMGYRYPATQ